MCPLFGTLSIAFYSPIVYVYIYICICIRNTHAYIFVRGFCFA